MAIVIVELVIGLLVMPWSTLHHPAVDLLIALVALPANVWAACRVELPARLLPLFAFSGTISYAIYVLDVPFAFIVQDLASRSHLLRHPSGVSAVILLPGIVLLTWCAHWYYDIPVRRALLLRSRGWLAARPKRTAGGRYLAAISQGLGTRPQMPRPQNAPHHSNGGLLCETDV